jgi:hypothetical protein
MAPVHDIATTASYQATLPGLMKRGLDTQQAANVLLLHHGGSFWGAEDKLRRSGTAAGARLSRWNTPAT